MSSDNNDTGESSGKMSPDMMKKLNDAFSSYLDGKGTADIADNNSEKDSLLELVRQGIAEKQKQIEEELQDESQKKDDSALIEDINENSQVTDAQEPVKPSIPGKVPDVLSGVFDDFQYQSVEIEDTGTEDNIGNDESSHYSEVAAEILKQRSKESKSPFPDYSKEEKKASASLPSNPNIEFKEPVSRPKPVKVEDDDNIVVSRAFIKKAPVAAETKSNLKDALQNDTITDVSPKKPPISTGVKASDSAERPKALTGKVSSTISSTSVSSKGHKEAEKATKEPVKKPVTSKKVETFVSDGPVNIAFLYNKDHTSHDAASLSMNTHEKPERLIKAMWYLEKNSVFEDGTCTLLEKFDMADEADLLRVHEESYISFVRNYANAGGGFLGDSTYMTKTSYDIARMAAGAAIAAGDLIVDRKFSHAFVLARPPGHHASTEKYGGFCLFNNAAILARYLQKRRNVGKILILDWDAHAGDGTMEIFYEDPSVMFLSVHRDPHGFYPRKGFSTQVGENAGKGYTLNVEMPEGSGNEEYFMAFDETIIPMIEYFSPELIIFSCGFDAYYKEKNIGLTLDSDGYHQLTSKVLSVFRGPLIFLMEGGYHDSNGQLCHSVLSALHGKPNPVSDKQEISSYKLTLRKKLFEDARKKVEESKKYNPILSSKVSE